MMLRISPDFQFIKTNSQIDRQTDTISINLTIAIHFCANKYMYNNITMTDMSYFILKL